MENVVSKEGEDVAWVVFDCVVVFGALAEHGNLREEANESRVFEFSAKLGVEGVGGGKGGVEQGGYMGGDGGEECGDISGGPGGGGGGRRRR